MTLAPAPHEPHPADSPNPPLADELLEDIRLHILACEEWAPNLDLPPLTSAERAQVHARINQLAEERAARADAHRERIVRTARYLGREVVAHQATTADAERRLEALALTVDPESLTATLMVPYREAVDIIGPAFAAGYQLKAV
jgi:hypothetical protein